MSDKPATLVSIKQFFELGTTPFKNAIEFSTQWKALTPEDQAQIRAGVGNGTFTY